MNDFSYEPSCCIVLLYISRGFTALLFYCSKEDHGVDVSRILVDNLAPLSRGQGMFVGMLVLFYKLLLLDH